MKRSKRRSVISVGKDAAEVRIYTLRRKADGYTSYQCAWYSLGARATKVFADLAAAKTFAQQKTVELSNGRLVSVEASFREIEILRGCEARVAELGVTLTAAIEEWSVARRLLGGFSLIDAARAHAGTHAGIKSITLAETADLFVASREAAQLSDTYIKGLRCYFKSLKRQFGPCLIADLTTPQLDGVLQQARLSVVTKNNMRRTLVTLFKWARDQGYLQAERKTAAERTMTFNEPGTAPAIFTPEELTRIIGVPGEPAAAHCHRCFRRDPVGGDRAAGMGGRAVGAGLHRDQGAEGEDEGPATRAAAPESAGLAGAVSRADWVDLPSAEYARAFELCRGEGGLWLAPECAEA